MERVCGEGVVVHVKVVLRLVLVVKDMVCVGVEVAEWVGLTGLTVTDGDGDALEVKLSLSECVKVEFSVPVGVRESVALTMVLDRLAEMLTDCDRLIVRDRVGDVVTDRVSVGTEHVQVQVPVSEWDSVALADMLLDADLVQVKELFVPVLCEGDGDRVWDRDLEPVKNDEVSVLEETVLDKVQDLEPWVVENVLVGCVVTELEADTDGLRVVDAERPDPERESDIECVESDMDRVGVQEGVPVTVSEASVNVDVEDPVRSDRDPEVTVGVAEYVEVNDGVRVRLVVTEVVGVKLGVGVAGDAEGVSDDADFVSNVRLTLGVGVPVGVGVGDRVIQDDSVPVHVRLALRDGLAALGV
mmetsp:Transcript_13994/g.24965  ORF Transcript_13994/g.24965 Transcript_13994/m.24965 type:complete len:357 (+) Transcript_13994:5107-6177(+)